MAFGVFIHRSDSIYDDTPAEKYQFPKQYLDRARACIGDWIVYYEPRKVIGTKGYHAVATRHDTHTLLKSTPDAHGRCSLAVLIENGPLSGSRSSP